MPKRRIEEVSYTGGLDAVPYLETGVFKGQVNGPFLAELNDEVLLQIMSLLPGWMAWRLEATGLPAWKRNSEMWWQSRCDLEFSSTTALGSWRQTYRRLLGLKAARRGVWCYSSRRHGLGDRVAAPQLFVGPSGQKLFCYGGWTDGGPQTDLRWVTVDAVRTAAMDSSSEAWRFQAAEALGAPARAGGVQSLTTLWFEKDAPSESHITQTAQQLQRGQPGAINMESGAALVMAFGGGGGGYRHEHNSWAIGVLSEGQGSDTSKILWGRPSCKEPGTDDPSLSYQPTPRCAHSATFIPSRFTGMAEGCVVVFGGHTQNCTTSLTTAEMLSLNDWQWQPLIFQKSDALGEDWEVKPRHGHSTTLFEVDGKGYLVVVGGGTGNILENYGVTDIGDVSVLAIESWTWIGHYQLPTENTPGRHHTACRGIGNQLLVMGGGRRPSDKVCVLDAEACIRRAILGDALGDVDLRPVPCNVGRSPPEDGSPMQCSLPSGRKMHGAASLAPFAPLLVIYGGWKTGPHFNDLWTFALGADEADLQDFEALERRSSAADEHDDGDEMMSDSPFVGVRMMGPDGQVRMMRIPSELLSQFVRQGMVRRMGADPPDDSD